MNKEEILFQLESSSYFKFTNNWKYIGPIGCWNNKMPQLAKEAYTKWKGEGTRCNNKKVKAFKTYGKKGIKRIWKSRECINWYINALLTRDFWENPQIARYADKGNYEIENVFLIERLENIKERKSSKSLKKQASITGKKYGPVNSIKMNKLKRKKVKLTNIENPKDTLFFSSATKASIELGKTRTAVAKCIAGKWNIQYKNNKYKPEYEEKNYENF